MARRYYSSTAARTTLASGVDDSTTTLSVVAVSGWPASYPYTLVIDQDTVNEELVSVTNRSGTTLTVTRGIDGTSAVAHDAGAAVNHGVSAQDFDEPNEFINGTGVVTSDMIVDGTIVNADVNASAAIAQSKIADLTSDLASKVDYATPTNAQTGTAYTFVADDAERLTTASNGSAVTLTVPPQSSVTWSDNTILRVANYGAGEVTVDGGSGVTVTNTETTLAQYTTADVVRTASDAWTLLAGGGGGGGKILQIVRATDSTQRTTTSTSFVDASISVTITPQKSDSAIILIWAAGVAHITTSQTMVMAITDSSDNVITETSPIGSTSVTNFFTQTVVFAYATPATTSATTYKGRFRVNTSGTGVVNYNSEIGQLYAIEVSA